MKHKGPHKYHKIPHKYLSVWSCALPDCSHYMPAHQEHLLEGKSTICWRCDEVTTLTVDSMQCISPTRENVLEPLCDKCRFELKTGLSANFDSLAAILNHET